jgi:hypothetical protein
MTNKLVEEAPYHPGYEDAGFKPPAKTLTDEEKDEIIAEFMGEYYKGDIVLHQMISAILRKAQEK